MGRRKKTTGEWKPRNLTCGVCRDKYPEREPTELQKVTGVECICPKCDQRRWDIYEGKKPNIVPEFDDEVRKWNKESGWGTPDASV